MTKYKHWRAATQSLGFPSPTKWHALLYQHGFPFSSLILPECRSSPCSLSFQLFTLSWGTITGIFTILNVYSLPFQCYQLRVPSSKLGSKGMISSSCILELKCIRLYKSTHNKFILIIILYHYRWKGLQAVPTGSLKGYQLNQRLV